MNDFTKEELERIQIALSWNIQAIIDNDAYGDVDDIRNLRKKVIGMYAYYCEHKNIYPDYGCITRCKDCEAKL